MPIIKSAKKRVKVAARASARNAKTRRTLRDAIKTFSKSLSSGKTDEIVKAEQAVISAIDMAAKKAVIHKNKAARKKAQLAAKAKAAGVKPSTKTVGSKPSMRQTQDKKAKSQKPTAKRPTASKPAVSRTPTHK